jgi:hypothetical protein
MRAARPWRVLGKEAHGFVIGRDLALDCPVLPEL